MFKNFIRKISGKAADEAVEGVKETLNDKIDRYGDIIQVGLVMAVIGFGGYHLTRRNRNAPPGMPDYGYSGPPVIVNNYYPGSYSYGYGYPVNQRPQQRRRTTYEHRVQQRNIQGYRPAQTGTYPQKR